MDATNDSTLDVLLTNDSTLDVLLTTSQLIPLAIYTTLATILGLIGNTVVLYSSIRYNAIQMDKVSLLLVQNLAAADLLYIFTNMIPASISYIAKKYVLGKVYCFWTAQTPFIPAGVNTLTVFAITAYRLRLLLSPMNNMPRGRAKMCIGAIWVIAAIPTIMALVYGAESKFSQKSAKCFSTIYFIKSASVLFRFVWGTIVIVPVISIVIINILLFAISSKYRTKQDSSSAQANNLRALTTICALSGVFIISWIPNMIMMVWKGVDSNAPKVVEQIGISTVMLNAFCNPILYTITNKRFGKFVWKMVSGVIPSKSGVSTTAKKSSNADSSLKKTAESSI